MEVHAQIFGDIFGPHFGDIFGPQQYIKILTIIFKLQTLFTNTWDEVGIIPTSILKKGMETNFRSLGNLGVWLTRLCRLATTLKEKQTKHCINPNVMLIYWYFKNELTNIDMVITSVFMPHAIIKNGIGSICNWQPDGFMMFANIFSNSFLWGSSKNYSGNNE